MVRRQEPSARQERLGTELRKLREAVGLKAGEAAALLGTNSAQMSHIESGMAGVSQERVRRLVAHYACTDGELTDALVAMAADRTKGWWERYRGLLPTPFLDLSELEHHSSFRWDVDFLHVPGLLQTKDYARALFSARVPELPQTELDLRVEHRMARRAVIQEPSLVPYEAVIHEAALRMRIGGRAASRSQLTHILEASEADNVTVRVIPFDLDDFADVGSAMVYLGGPVPQLDTVVRDAPHGTIFIDSVAQLAVFRTLFRRVRSASLEPAQSRDFIHKLTKDL